MCVWVRDLHVPLCTLATGRGVHITSTGKGHTKHKAKKQNINKEDKISCVFVSRRKKKEEANKKQKISCVSQQKPRPAVVSLLICCSSAAAV